jgi:hypothetical protein
MNYRRIMLTVFVLVFAIVLPISAQEATEEPSNRYEGDGFSLYLPPNATVEETEDGVVILGPELTIRPAEMDFTVGGAAYALTITTAENPDGLSSEDWATERILADWQTAQEQGEMTGTMPVTDDGELREEDVQHLTVGGLDAFQVNFFGGDSTIVSVYVAHGDQVTVFNYVENIVENNPLALVQQDIYALLFDSVEFSTAE